ncbi:MAG TPA: hypothetical protein VF003_12370 [Pseudonocardiaceae bacterium]
MSSAVVSAQASLPDAGRSVACRPLRALAGGYLGAPGLPAGTRVQLKGAAELTGTVMSYQRECVPGWLGLFPVRLDNAIWQTCHAGDVIVLAPAQKAPSGIKACAETGR